MNLRMDAEGFSMLLKNIAEGVIIADRGRHVTFMNPAAGALTGWQPEDAMGKPLHDVFILAKDKTAGQAEDPVAAAVEQGAAGSLGIHVPLIAKDGTQIAICGSCTPLRDDQEEVRGAILVFRDSTECKQIADTLRMSEEKYKRIVEHGHDVIMVTQPDGIISYMSPACAEVLGWTSEDLVGKQPWIIHPDDLVKAKEVHYRALMGESGVGFEYRIRTKAGAIKWISHSWSPEFREGRVHTVVSIVRDITEQKRAEEVVKEALSRFEAVIENTPLVAIQGFDREGIIHHWNAACRHLYGFTAAEVVGKRLQDILLSGEAAQEFERILDEIWDSGRAREPQEWPVRTRSGEERWVYSTMFPVFEHGAVSEVFCMDVDITDRKRAEEAVRIQRDLAQSYLDLAGVIFVALDTAGNITLMNKMGCKVLGYEERYLLGRNWFDTCLPEGLRKDVKSVFRDVKSVFRRLVAGEIEPVEYFENPVLTKNGDERIIAWHNTVLRDETRRIVGTLSSGEDITERKQADEALKESEARYRTMFEQLADAVFIEGLDGNILELNSAACKLMGADRQTLLAKKFTEFLAEETIQDLPNIINRLMAGECVLYETKVSTMDGRTLDIQSSLALIHIGGECRVQVVSRDITEQKRLQEQLYQAQKLESIATLAGGIAHDFNNLMTTVMGRASLLREELGVDHPADTALSVIEKAAARASHLAHQLLAYAREGKYELQVLNLNEIVRDTVRFCEHLIAPNVRLELDIEQSLPNIMADPTQMHQVVMNLFTNAVEAMPEGGRITFHTRGVRFAKKNRKLPEGLAPGSYVSLTIRDTGHGMDKATQARIFEPFFTTKFIGRGLGLAAIYGIVTNHGGSVTVESEIGKGTIFTVYLPATEKKLKKTERLKAAAFRGNETILVIDDEPSILTITERILQRFGYQILLATSGEQALELAQNYEGTIHLALLDLSMPRLAGTEVYPRLAALRPDMKVLISTGYTLDEPAQRLLEAGAQGFIQKPYMIDALVRRIREILDGL